MPGNILKLIDGQPLLSYIFDRVSFLRHPAQLVLASSELSSDNIVESFFREIFVNYFRGSEENILERYYLCARQHDFNLIIRLTGDNPLVDIEEIGRLIDRHTKEHVEYFFTPMVHHALHAIINI